MNKKTYTKITDLMGAGVFILMMLTACIANPMDDEQYIKQVVLIGASEEYQEKKIKYGTEGEFFVAVYCAGTQPPEKDVTVTLEEAHKINIDNFNYKNVLEGNKCYEALPKDWYELPSYTGVIKAGERYVRIPIRINTSKISADDLYMIPLKIMDSYPYPINEQTDTVLLVKVKMINNYSGVYTTTGIEYPVKGDGTLDKENPLPFYPSRTLTAISENQVRLFHKLTEEKEANLEKNGIIIDVDKATNQVSVSAYKEDGGLSISNASGTYIFKQENYGVQNRIFKIEYDYMDGDKKKHIIWELKSTESFQ